MLTDELLGKVLRPGQYLGNEWGARRKSFETAQARLVLAFPDLYELGMSNFGLKILYQLINEDPRFMADRTYAPAEDMEKLLRDRNLPLWAWESRMPIGDFDLVGFSLQYELTYTNVLNMLDLARIPVKAADRENLLPLVFGGGPSAVNPEPMSEFMDFFIIGDGEVALPSVLSEIAAFKAEHAGTTGDTRALRLELLARLATRVSGVYVPALYEVSPESPVPKPVDVRAILHDEQAVLPARVLRQTVPLSNENQPTASIVPYLSLVHDREVLEVRRGCDRGCRFCQPGYTFLPVRERSADDLLELSKQALGNSGHQEYSMLSLCVSDYTSLHESVRALNAEHSARRASLSFPSQRADRMNLDVAEELKAVRKSGITLAPEAGTERLRKVINKGLSHEQIISAIEAAYQSGWSAVKLYFMCCLPTETDEDLVGIVDILKEASMKCRAIRRAEPTKHKKDMEFTCTISNFVPKPFTPFQWFGQVNPRETARKHQVLRNALRDARLRNVQLNVTEPQISLLEAAISRGDRKMCAIIYDAWRSGCTFDAWDEKFQPQRWHEVAKQHGEDIEALSCNDREVGGAQCWDVVHIGLHTWWLVKEWEKALTQSETAPCTENLCHACGVCTELDATHLLAAPKPEVMKRNPFVKELAVSVQDDDSHPSLFFMAPDAAPQTATTTKIRFVFCKKGDLRFISHLDLQTLFQRAARRGSLNLAYSQGFNPQPKLALAAALPLFHESEGEVGEVDLAEAITSDEFRSRINEQLPPEVQVLAARELPQKTASLSSLLHSAKCSATLLRLEQLCGASDADAIAQHVQKRIDEMIACDQLISNPDSVAQPGPKPETPRDIRAGVHSLRITQQSPLTLEFEIAHGQKMHVKPSELLGLIQPPDSVPQFDWRITRRQLSSESGDSLFNA